MRDLTRARGLRGDETRGRALHSRGGVLCGGQAIGPHPDGVAVGLALRGAAIPGEVADHDARAEAFNTDLIRWVRDRGEQLNAEIYRALNLARLGIIEDVAQPEVERRLDEGIKPGSQEYSGAFVNRIQRLMRQALREYRDEASRKIRAYRTMARSEGWFHRRLRRGRQPVPLRLADDALEVLASWRERVVPTTPIPGLDASTPACRG